MSNIKASSDVWKLCIERFSTTAYAEVKFWCLQTLQGVRLLLLRGWHTIETQLQELLGTTACTLRSSFRSCTKLIL